MRENPNSQRYQVEKCNKIITVFSDIFGYSSLINIQNSSNDSSENLIWRQWSTDMDISSSNSSYCNVKLKLEVHNDEEKIVMSNGIVHLSIVFYLDCLSINVIIIIDKENYALENFYF